MGVHLLLLQIVHVGDRRGIRRAEEASGILFFVEIPQPEDTPPATPISSQRRLSTSDSRFETEVTRDNAITLSPEIDERPIDWNAEARRVAGEVAGRESPEEEPRSPDRRSPRPNALVSKPTHHELGESQRFEGGVIIDWISKRCYYTNQNYSSPYASGDAFGQKLRVQTPVCK